MPKIEGEGGAWERGDRHGTGLEAKREGAGRREGRGWRLRGRGLDGERDGAGG